MAELPSTTTDLTQLVADTLAGFRLHEGREALGANLTALVAVAAKDHHDADEMVDELAAAVKREVRKHWNYYRTQAASQQGAPGHG